MATRARTQPVATALPHLQSSAKGQLAPALQVSTQLDPVESTDTATSTPSSYRTDCHSVQIDSPISSRTSLLTSASTTSLQLMPAKKSSKKASISQAAPAETTDTELGAATVERRGRSTRRPKPTTKAIELANNTGSKFFKSLKKADFSETSQAEEVDDGYYQSARGNEKAKSSSIVTTAKSTMTLAKQPVKQRSLTPGTTQDNTQTRESPETTDTQRANSGPRGGAGGAAECLLTATAASAMLSGPSKRKQTAESDEVVQQATKKQRTSPSADAKPGKPRHKQPQQEQEEEFEAGAPPPIKKPIRTTKSSSENRGEHKLEFTTTATELSRSSEHASSKTRRPRGFRTPTAPTELSAGGNESSGSPPVKPPRITLKFPSPTSLADSEEPKDEETAEAATHHQTAKRGRRKIQAPQLKYENLNAEKGFTPEPNKRKRRSRSPIEETGDLSENNLAPRPTEPKRTRRAKDKSSQLVDDTNTQSATWSVNSAAPSSKQQMTTKRKVKDMQQKTLKICNGLCMTMPEKIMAMYEIVAADPDNAPDTQEKLDALMLAYCKCGEWQDEVPEQKIMLKFRGLRKDKDSEEV